MKFIIEKWPASKKVWPPLFYRIDTWMSDIELAVVESFVVANLDEDFLDRPFRTRSQDVELILR